MKHANAHGPVGFRLPKGMAWSGRLLVAFFLALWASGVQAQCPTEIEVAGPITCSGADDAVLTVAIPDGVDPAEVYWLLESDTLFGAVQSGLGPGSYLAFVPGCGTLGINVNEPFPFFISTSIDFLPTCDDPCSGVVTATPNFGQAPFVFNWSHDAGQMGGTATGICEQVILVTATDANGCTDDAIVTMEIPPVEVLAFSTDPSCNGSEDGSASAVATGGLGGAFVFSWADSQGNAAGVGADLTGLAAGTYSVTATGPGGCSASTSVTLADPAPLAVDLITSPVSCAGDADGAATAFVEGAVNYDWTGPGGFSVSGADLGTVENLVPGVYTLLVTGAEGCVGIGSAVVEEPLPLTVEPFQAPPSCPGDANGTVGIVPLGGTGPAAVSWSWPVGNSATGSFLNGVAAGDYTYSVADENGCMASGTLTLEDPAPLAVSVTATSPSCAEGPNANDGGVVAVVSGGVPPYLSSWLEAQTLDLVSAGLEASGIGAGQYAFGAVDAAGCTVDTVIFLTSPDALALSLSVNGPSCFGLEDGEAAAETSGGTPGYTLAWTGPIPPTLGPAISGLSAGAYAVEATDGNGCVVDTAFALIEPEPLVWSVTTTPVGCNGADGVLMSDVTGGTPGYAVTWTGPEGFVGSSLAIDGLVPGLYSGAVLDANGCFAASTVEVEALLPLTLSVTAGPLDCTTGEGTFFLDPTGGEPPLEMVLVSVGGTPESISGNVMLSPGSHVVSVTDARGCLVDTTIVLSPPVALSLTVDPAGCGGLGSMVAEASGGLGAFSWSVTPDVTADASSDVGATWAGLEAGSYAVTADDGVCSVTQDAEVEGVELFDWTLLTEDAACLESPGAISIQVTSATAPVEYQGASLDGALTWTAADAVGLPAGDYLISASDAAGCLRDTVVTIGALESLSLVVSVSELGCFGAADGAFELSATGGTEPYVFGADGPTGLIFPPFEGLSEGTYLAGVLDNRGCIADTVLVLDSPGPIDVSTAVYPESCPGLADGQASVMATGGTGDLLVAWTDGPLDTVWTGLGAGDYVWTVTDASGCDTTGVVVVEAGLGPVVMDTVLAGACEEGVPSAEVQLFVASGSGDETVLLGGLPADGVADVDTGFTWTWIGLVDGNYGWTVSVGEACGSSGEVEVNLPNPLEWIGTVTSPVCEGDSGYIVGITTGGDGLVQTLWTGLANNGDSLGGTSLNTGLIPEGQYAFSAFDEAGCLVDTTVSVVALSSGLSLEVELIQPSCGGALAGEASLMPMGGVPPYAVNVQGAADTVFLPFLLPGAYPVTLTDSVGCFTLDTLVVDPASDFTLVAQVDSATCSNSEDGQVVLLPSNATGSVDYTFVGPFGAMPAGDTIVSLGAGIYEVTGLDEAGCPAVVLVSVGAPDPLVVNLENLDRPSCVDDADGALAISASGGSGDPSDWTAQWFLDQVAYAEGLSLEGLMEGTYSVIVTDGAGCTGDIASIPLIAEGDVVLSSPADTVLCSGSPLGLEALATGAATTTWSIGESWPTPGLQAYTVEVPEGVELWVFTAARLGCVRTDTVRVEGLALPTVDAGVDLVIPEGQAASIGTSGLGEWTYVWTPAEDVVSPESPTTATQPLFVTTDFVLSAMTEAGCAASDTATVEVLQELDIPSGFTPNDDGVNDRWNLGGLDQYPSAEITVFNRWGDILFTQDATEGPWDGTLDGIPAPVGTYYYFIRVSEPALQAEWTGPITLMR